MHDKLRPPALRSECLHAIIRHFIRSKITGDPIFKEGNNLCVATGNVTMLQYPSSRLEDIIGDIIIEESRRSYGGCVLFFLVVMGLLKLVQHVDCFKQMWDIFVIK